MQRLGRRTRLGRASARHAALGALALGVVLGGCAGRDAGSEPFDGRPVAARLAPSTTESPTTTDAPPTTDVPVTTVPVTSTAAPIEPVAPAPSPAAAPAAVRQADDMDAAIGEIDALLDEIDAALADTSADN